jgi:hypothetical protein
MQKSGKAEMAIKKLGEPAPKPKWVNNTDEMQSAIQKIFTEEALSYFKLTNTLFFHFT